MVTAVACAEVPKFTILIGGSFGAGNYAMAGRAYSPRFLWSWPNTRISVMGGIQAARVLSTVRETSLPGGAWPSEREREAFEAPILETYEREGSPYFATARLWDDGVIDPLDTRRILAMGIEASLCAPIPETGSASSGCDRRSRAPRHHAGRQDAIADLGYDRPDDRRQPPLHRAGQGPRPRASRRHRADRGRRPRGPAVLPRRRDRPAGRRPHRRVARAGRRIDDPDGSTLRLTMPDGRVVDGPVPRRRDRDEDVRTCRRRARRRGPWAAALSTIAGRDVRLIRTDEPGGTRTQHHASLVSDGSLGRLGDQLGVGAVDGRRSRCSSSCAAAATTRKTRGSAAASPSAGRPSVSARSRAAMRHDPDSGDASRRSAIPITAPRRQGPRLRGVRGDRARRRIAVGDELRSSRRPRRRGESTRLDDEAAAEELRRLRSAADRGQVDRRASPRRPRPAAASVPGSVEGGRPAGRRRS